MVSVVRIIPLALCASLAIAQDFPNRTIRIVTSNAGGNSDFVARNIAQAISGPLGQPVVVDNRTSILAPTVVLAEKPDGYTVLLGGGSLWVRPLLSKLPYDAVRDFAPVSLVSREINLLLVHPSIPAKSVKELIALAKARPGQLNYATSGIGGSNHLAVELFKSMANIDVVGVHYKGSAPAISGLVGGEVQMEILDFGLAMPLVKAGRVRALAVATPDPSALVPGMPTVAEAGLPGFESVSVTGMSAPAKTPTTAIQRINQEVVRYLRTPEAKQRLLANGTEAVGSPVEQFDAAIKADIARWSKVIKEANIKLE